MSDISDIAVLFHAFNLDAGFSSTKISKIFKTFSELCHSGDDTFSEVRKKVLETLGVPSDAAWQQALQEIHISKDSGVQVITFLDQNYPEELKHLPDPPLVLFVTGRVTIEAEFWSSFDRISVVGSRTTSPYGVAAATNISKQLVFGGNSIVSGLAYGIDKAAHQGAILAVKELTHSPHPCPTIAVLGSGLLELYPKLHVGLANDIIQAGGLILSEYGLYLKPRTYLFPRRNRIVSGLSQSVIIVEAQKKSGSLITARLALEQGKDLYCVPGPIDSPLSEGVNDLIRDGAGIISNIYEFAQTKISKKMKMEKNTLYLVPKKSNDTRITKKSMSSIQEKIHDALTENNKSFEELLELNILDEQTLRLELYQLEIADIIEFRDGRYARK